MKIRIISLSIVAILAMICIPAYADLYCNILPSCPTGSTALLYFENDTSGFDDAHAELPSSATSPYVLCCNSTSSTIASDCGVIFLKLSDESNAHVHDPSYENPEDYPYNACISADTNVSCTISTTGCLSDRTCLLSIESDETTNLTNAHVGSCDTFATDVCCSVNSYPNEVSLYSPADGTTNLTDITPIFIWHNTSDPDSPSLTYQLQVTEEHTGFQNLTDNVSDIPEGTNLTSYSPSTELTVGVTYLWRVRAFDGLDYGNWSENWTFTIQALTSPATGSSGGGGGGGGGSPQLVAIDLIECSNISAIQGERIVNPCTIKNTNPTITLFGINLSLINGNDFITAQLDNTFIEKLAPGETQSVNLIMQSNSSGTGELSVVAEVGDPPLTDSVKFYITALPQNVAEVENRIKFVKDLFKENPKCLELNELVFRAERAFQANNYTEAAALLEKVISKCKDLITYKEPETPLKSPNKSAIQKCLLFLILNVLLAIILISFRKMVLKKRGKEEND